MKLARGVLKADGLLLLTAIIWGLAFSAQRSGMEHIGPFGFNALRLFIGALSILPLILISRRRSARLVGEAAAGGAPANQPRPSRGQRLAWIALAGSVLFFGSTFQQMGLVTTTAGNAGFITCLYVVLVPLLGLFWGRKAGLRIWIGALLALAGLYILSIGAGFTMMPGDRLELAGSLFWALHILVVARFANRMDALELAAGQYLVCSVLSLAAALAFEGPDPFSGALGATIPILYGGVLSTGVAFTLQIIAQKTAHPAHASIILAMEALFAGIGGILVLGEPLTARLTAGGLLMLAGMVLSQIEPSRKSAEAAAAAGAT